MHSLQHYKNKNKQTIKCKNTLYFIFPKDIISDLLKQRQRINK